jgi:hypothetical protein
MVVCAAKWHKSFMVGSLVLLVVLGSWPTAAQNSADLSLAKKSSAPKMVRFFSLELEPRASTSSRNWLADREGSA